MPPSGFIRSEAQQITLFCHSLYERLVQEVRVEKKYKDLDAAVDAEIANIDAHLAERSQDPVVTPLLRLVRDFYSLLKEHDLDIVNDNMALAKIEKLIVGLKVKEIQQA